MKKLTVSISSTLANIAMSAVKLNVNSTCLYIAHQPELPEKARKLRKF